MLLFFVPALAATPWSERTFGAGVSVPFTPNWLTSESTTVPIWTPQVHARFQLGRVALGPKVRFNLGRSTLGGEEGSTHANVGGGLDLRLSTVSTHGLTLVGLLGAEGSQSSYRWEEASSKTTTVGSDVGAGLEGTPNKRVSVELGATTPLFGLGISSDRTVSWSGGLSSLSAHGGASLWF